MCVCLCLGGEEMYIKRTKESGSSRDEQKGTKGGGKGGRGGGGSNSSRFELKYFLNDLFHQSSMQRSFPHPELDGSCHYARCCLKII